MPPKAVHLVAPAICLSLLGACNPFELSEAMDQAERQQAALAKADRMVKSMRGRDALMELATKVLMAGVEDLEQVQSVGPTPPLDACCHDDTNRCRTSEADWEQPTWKSVGFASASADASSFSVERDATTITLIASADLDCNGTRQTHRIVGKPDAKGIYDFTDIATENADE